MTTPLEQSLQQLYQQAIALGHITPAQLQQNIYYTYPAPKLGVNFKAQINVIRNNYIKDMGQRLACAICYENQLLPNKQALRTHEFSLCDRKYFAQYTPYPLFNHHAILITREHTPMRIERRVVAELLDFIEQCPDYTCCSNSDIAWAGASILDHHHYQVFKSLTLPIQTAHARHSHSTKNVVIEWLNFPIACCRISCHSAERITQIGGDIIDYWKAQANNNTCNLLLDYRNGLYRLHILFRNPQYRTPEALHVVKQEGIGVVEVCGYGIYPVPSSMQAWSHIESDGLHTIQSIIAGNNPIQPQQQADFWQQLCNYI